MRVMNNLVQLAGALTGDPDLHTLTDGTYVVNFRIRTFRSSGEPSLLSSNSFSFRLYACGHIAMEIERNFQQGSRILVRGELRNRAIGRKGERRYRTEVLVHEFLALGKAREESSDLLTAPVEKQSA